MRKWTQTTQGRIGLALLALAVIGFVLSTEAKDRFLIQEERFSTTGQITVPVAVEAGTPYRLFLWAVDEEQGLQAWAGIEFAAKVLDSQGGVVAERKTSANASSAQETGGIRRAQNGFEFALLPEQSGEMQVIIDFVEGDTLDLEVYRGLSDLQNLLPGLYILSALAGLVLVLKARAAAAGR